MFFKNLIKKNLVKFFLYNNIIFITSVVVLNDKIEINNDLTYFDFN
jgi:hypothetical protein